MKAFQAASRRCPSRLPPRPLPGGRLSPTRVPALPQAALAGSLPEAPAVAAWGLGVTVWDPVVTAWVACVGPCCGDGGDRVGQPVSLLRPEVAALAPPGHREAPAGADRARSGTSG